VFSAEGRDVGQQLVWHGLAFLLHRVHDASQVGGFQTIVPIGRWMLEEAARAVILGLLDPVAVNVSAKEFAHPSFVRNVEKTLARVGLDPARLTLEIKEGSLLDLVRAPEVLGALRALGIQLELDDFGLGLTSLTVLSALPLDVLRLDRTVTARVGTGTEAGGRAIRLVWSVVQLAGSLGFRTVAEGVETRLQAQLLKNAGGTHLQGYLFGRPGRWVTCYPVRASWSPR
jgi:EAL domain-containing protein (putative c-di-GMP-specific phosphodiesterase class I)